MSNSIITHAESKLREELHEVVKKYEMAMVTNNCDMTRNQAKEKALKVIAQFFGVEITKKDAPNEKS